MTAPFLHRLLGLVRVEVEAAAGGGVKAELSLPAVSSRRPRRCARPCSERPPRPTRGRARRALHRATSCPARPRRRHQPELPAGPGSRGRRRRSTSPTTCPAACVERAGSRLLDLAPTTSLGIARRSPPSVVAIVLVFAAAGSLLVDWHFTLADEGERLTAARGLLTRRVVVLDRDRIRGTDVRDTPLRRPFGLVSVTAIAAGPAREIGRNDARARAARGRCSRPAPRGRRRSSRLTAPLCSASTCARRRGCCARCRVPLVLLAGATAFVRAVGDRGRARADRRWRPWLRARPLPPARPRASTAGACLFAGEPPPPLVRVRPGRRPSPTTCAARPASAAPASARSVHLGQGAGSRRALDPGEGQAATLLDALDPPLLGPLRARDERGAEP